MATPWDSNSEARQQAVAGDAAYSSAPPPRTIRALDVLRFAGGLVSIALALLVLAQYACLLWGDVLLRRAAQAALQEAALPHATRASVNAAACRAMENVCGNRLLPRVEISVGGRSELFHPLDKAWPGERVAVCVSLPRTALMPRVLACCGLAPKNEVLEVRASGRIPL